MRTINKVAWERLKKNNKTYLHGKPYLVYKCEFGTVVEAIKLTNN